MNANGKFCPLLRASWAVVFSLLTGCASQTVPARVVFKNLSINGKPVRMVLDTGASSTVLYNTAAKRVGLQFSPPSHDASAEGFEVFAGISGPALIKAGSQMFTSRIPIFTLPAAAREDGVIGWPDVQDNVLLFDTDHHTVCGVPHFVETTSAWLKLKVRPHGTLQLEIPLAEGKTGIFLLDTGSPQGIQLCPALWQEFKATHPHTPSAAANHFSWSTGSFSVQSMWADEIKLGALSLTGVPVESMPSNQVAWFRKANPEADAFGVIGMAAVARMDLVVDAKNNTAYLKPKPPSAEPQTAGLWSVAENVLLYEAPAIPATR